MNDPRREDVEAILDHLGRCTTGFVILAVSEQKYIQTIFRTKERPQDGFDVEYQAGSTKRHYELDAEHLDLPMLKRLFLAYYDNPSSARTLGKWEKMSFE